MHKDDLHRFTSQSTVSIKFVLDKLSWVICTTDNCIFFDHLSFAEFLCDPAQCPRQFLVDRGSDSQNLAMSCFRLMKDGLKFNICDLETSHVPQ